MSATADMEPTTATFVPQVEEQKPVEEQKKEEFSAPSSPPSSPVEIVTSEPASTTPKTPEETEAETPKMAHDSMVTVRLSEPPNLTLDTTVAEDGVFVKTTEPQLPEDRVSEAATEVSVASSPEKRASTASTIGLDANRSLQDELADEDKDDKSQSSEDQEEVDWAKLEQTEDEQTKDDETDNVGYQPNPPFETRRHANCHPCSPPPFSSSDLNKKTQNWLRTRRPSMFESPKKQLPPTRAHHPWPSYDRW